MKRTVFALTAVTVLAASFAVFAACGDDDDNSTPATTASATQPAATTTSAATTTTQATTTSQGNLQEILTEAVNEEYKARATYQAVIDKFGQQLPFTNIVSSENTHVEQWVSLLQKFGYPVPADPFAGKVTAPATLQAACATGVAAEKEDVALYDRLMKLTTNQEVLNVMQQQRQVSQDNHLPAFERCAQ